MTDFKPSSPKPSSSRAAIRRTSIVGLGIVAALIATGVALATVVNISGAVVAEGQLVVDSHVKSIRHPNAGVVARLAVAEGDRVRAGQLLVQLDDAQARANLGILSNRLDEFAARKARLVAERDGRTGIAFPGSLTGRANEPAVAGLMASERRLFELRIKARAGQKAQLQERVDQLLKQAQGLVEQQRATEAEIAIAGRELDGVRKLWAQRLITLQRVTAAERDAARLKGNLGQIVASIAENGAKLSETKLQIAQIDQDARSEVSKELRELEAQENEALEKKAAAEHELRNMSIRAPQAGIVHELSVHAAGAVVTPGEQIMQIVPVSDMLRVEARVAPQEIEQVTVGQAATIRISGLNQRTTPELNATVELVAPELSQDKRTQASYYVVRLVVSRAEFARLGDARLVAGMPVETFIRTSSRSMMSYLVKPLADQISRAFRER